MSLSADGKYLFCTTAGENTVTMYAVDQETGLLTKKFTLPISGDYPKDLMIFPDNKHIAIANHASNSITVFTVDYEKNIIMMNEKPMKDRDTELYPYLAGTGYMGAVGLRTGLIKVSLAQADKNRLRDE